MLRNWRNTRSYQVKAKLRTVRSYLQLGYGGKTSMKVTVKLFSLLRELVGNKSIDVELREGSTIEGLIEKMVSIYGLEFEKNIRHFNGLQVFLTLNGEGARLDSKLKNGDIVAFLPPVAGGVESREGGDREPTFSVWSHNTSL